MNQNKEISCVCGSKSLADSFQETKVLQEPHMCKVDISDYAAAPNAGGYAKSSHILTKVFHDKRKPKIVCLCGSTRFSDAFREANLVLTLSGEIVLTVGCDFKSDDAIGLAETVKQELDELHLRKIDLADYVYILNVDGYIGSSTQRELAYAMATGKPTQFLNQAAGREFLQNNTKAIQQQAVEFSLSILANK